MRGAVGGPAPADTHRVAVLLRRTAALTTVIVLVLLACVATALGSGRDVIADYQSNGQITACHTAEDFREALIILRADERLYGNAIEVIQEARATFTAEPGEPCEGVALAVDPVEAEDSGSGAGLWIGLAAAVGLIAVGAGLWARRGGADDDVSGDGPGGDGSGDGSSGPPAGS
jgi:hypothetical protein